MIQRKPLAALTLTTMLALSVLSGCGKSNNDTKATNASANEKESTNTAATANTSTNTNAANATTDESTAAGLEGKVVFWSMWSNAEPQAKVIDEAVKEFEAANPNVDVEVKYNGRDINKLIKPALESGEQIDIFEQDPGSALGNLKDHVLKLDELLEQPSIGIDGKSVKDSLLPSLMDWVKSLAAPAGLEEGYYAIPQQPYAVLFFYNKALFAQAGITAVPTSWDEFLADCELLKKAGVEPITFDDAYRDLFIGGYLGSAMGSDWTDSLVKDKTGEMWKDPIVLQFAKDMQILNDKGYFSKKIAGNKYPAGQQDLALGKVAMYLNGTWLPNEVAATAGPDFQWGSFQFPVVANGNDKGGQQGLSFGAQGLLMNKNSKNVPAAFELVKYLVGKKAQEGMSAQALAIPATIDSTWPAPLAEAAVAFGNAKVNMPWGFGIDNGGDFSSGTVLPTFMELATGKIKPEAYVSKMADQAKKFYEGK
ncbi:ABC transporter substrate-binding protein [Paenibacillus sp. CF384]|uniref:ABC transporter substrate-binding protein n=1 Tax=Paenibacillus sp. CF384 TaxID=1884382 RepID=UPI00089BB60E|nr:extracellular solute-binding protein [Paenibacillus sp. CF384]SDX94137.1 raffinose/stachyose/melibiose transport system substrate-binding protein [Paenibacillus sp. CF384]